MRERGECSAVGTGEETEETKRSGGYGGGYGVFGASSITCQAERTRETKRSNVIFGVQLCVNKR